MWCECFIKNFFFSVNNRKRQKRQKQVDVCVSQVQRTIKYFQELCMLLWLAPNWLTWFINSLFMFSPALATVIYRQQLFLFGSGGTDCCETLPPSVLSRHGSPTEKLNTQTQTHTDSTWKKQAVMYLLCFGIDLGPKGQFLWTDPLLLTAMLEC